MKQLSSELPSIESILAPLEASLEGVEKPLILSDFDHTLCHSYEFNPDTNNHHPQIDPEVIKGARSHNLLVATGRRANTAAISLLWESGLVAPTMPIIAENGGTIIERDAAGNMTCSDLVTPHELTELTDLQSTIPDLLPELPDGQRLIFKTGRTMLLARLQDANGKIEPKHQAWLTEQLREVITSDELSVVDTRVSVSIQHKSVSKGAAFLHYLHGEGILRKDIFVIGTGDGINDRELFEQADLSLGFSSAVTDMVDIEIPHGAPAMPNVLRAISQNTNRIEHTPEEQ